MKPLSRKFYADDTVNVARNLIGKVLVREINGERLCGIINETEAYRSDDPASHSYHGRSERNRAMFGPNGHAYVYFTYGMHHCMNVVAKKNRPAGGILIRSIIPLEGIDKMKIHRKTNDEKILTNGPGKVAQALAIDKKLYGIDLTKRGELFVADSTHKLKIKSTPRIGISKAVEKKWRFVAVN